MGGVVVHSFVTLAISCSVFLPKIMKIGDEVTSKEKWEQEYDIGTSMY